MTTRIMMISDHASPLQTLGGVDQGGQNVYVRNLSECLGKLGYAVDVFTRREDPLVPPVQEFGPNLRVVNVPAGPARPVPKEHMHRYLDEFTAYCRAMCSMRRYDIVHANFWMSGVVASELKRSLGIPFVITFHALGRIRKLHQAEADAFPEERGAIEERLVREADCVIAECPQDRVDLENYYGARNACMEIVPCGVDLGLFSPVPKDEARRRLGLPARGRILLQLGRIVPRKGIDTVIEALAILRRRTGWEDVSLVVAGGECADPNLEPSPEFRRLFRAASDAGVREHVHFAGRRSREELRYFYSASDLFFTTPWYEPFGITPLEAMACGTPVVGSRVGGIKYSVRDGIDGLLVPPKDPGAVAEAAERLLADPSELLRMGQRCRRRVERHFTWEQVAARVAMIYESVLGGSRTYGLPEREEYPASRRTIPRRFARFEGVQPARKLRRAM